jgi:hypothetical protein
VEIPGQNKRKKKKERMEEKRALDRRSKGQNPRHPDAPWYHVLLL